MHSISKHQLLPEYFFGVITLSHIYQATQYPLQQRAKMSQHPIHATPDEHASKISGITPSNTSQEASMEPNIEVPSLSDRNKASHFPFMKLPVGMSTFTNNVSEERELTFIFTSTEIRLEVYSHLLIAVASWPKDVKLEKTISRGVMLAIESIRGECFESGIRCDRTSYALLNYPSISLTPQLLRACRAIHQEAAPILYGGNIFGFYFWREGKFWDSEVQRQDWWIVTDNFCRDIYRNWGNHCNEEALEALWTPGLASFLHQTGQQNAASIKRMNFYQQRSWTISQAKWHGWAIKVNTLLLKYHVPGIQQVKYSHGYSRHPLHWGEYDEIRQEIEDLQTLVKNRQLANQAQHSNT